MIKLIRNYSTFLIFILLIYLRLQVRSINPLWTDELAEINSLKSLKYLITSYLPAIPGGYPGHYLLIFPLQILFPFNKYILGIPGLISHILVFLFIPNVISKLQIVSKEKLYVSGLLTRFLFAIDPMLTFQAMEVRPYSIFPLLWILSFFVIIKLFQLDRQSFTVKGLFLNVIIWLPVLFLIFNWHFYGAIMLITIYIFMSLKKRITLSSFKIGKYSSIIILVSIFTSFPVWNHFSRGSFTFGFNTIATIPVTITQIYSINKGFPKGITWQNWLYFFCLVIMLFIFSLQLWKAVTRRYRDDGCNNFFKINTLLVIMPISVIFLLDFVNHYGFWYRQFAWTMIPLYMSVGLFISKLMFIKHK